MLTLSLPLRERPAALQRKEFHPYNCELALSVSTHSFIGESRDKSQQINREPCLLSLLSLHRNRHACITADAALIYLFIFCSIFSSFMNNILRFLPKMGLSLYLTPAESHGLTFGFEFLTALKHVKFLFTNMLFFSALLLFIAGRCSHQLSARSSFREPGQGSGSH